MSAISPQDPVPLTFPLPVKRLVWDMERSAEDMREAIENANTNLGNRMSKLRRDREKREKSKKEKEEGRSSLACESVLKASDKLGGMIEVLQNKLTTLERERNKLEDNTKMMFESIACQTDPELSRTIDTEDSGKISTESLQVPSLYINEDICHVNSHNAVINAIGAFEEKNDVSEGANVVLSLRAMKVLLSEVKETIERNEKNKEDYVEKQRKSEMAKNVMLKSMEIIDYRNATSKSAYLVNLGLKNSELESKNQLIENFRKEVVRSDEKMTQAMKQHKMEKDRYQKKISALTAENMRLVQKS